MQIILAMAAPILQLGSYHRIDTILRTNASVAYSAGRYKQFKANIDDRPWWKYVAIMDDRTRDHHAQLHGKIFRHDDPIWQTIWPPNGFNCRCRVRALTEEQAKADGNIVTKTQSKDIMERVGVDQNTGEVIERPATIVTYKDPLTGQRVNFKPDKGWSHNPGDVTPRLDSNGNKPDNLLPGDRDGLEGAANVRGEKDYRAFNFPRLADTPADLWQPRPPPLAKQPTEAAAVALLLGELGLDKQASRIIATPADLDDVLLRREWLSEDGKLQSMRHVVEKRGDARERYANLIIPTLTDPLEVWLKRYDDGVDRRRFIALFEGTRKDQPQTLVIARENKDGSMFFNFVTPSIKRNYLDNQREGIFLYRKASQ